MLKYNQRLKTLSRNLRSDLTDSERKLWSRLRRKQILGVPFYRQKPIGEYIVDFYAPKAKLVVEVDGSQHLEDEQMQRDKRRDEYLREQGLEVLRFYSNDIFRNIEGVMEVIYNFISQRVGNGTK